MLPTKHKIANRGRFSRAEYTRKQFVILETPPLAFYFISRENIAIAQINVEEWSSISEIMLESKKQIQEKHGISFPRNLYFTVRPCFLPLLNYVSGRPLKYLIIIHGFVLKFGVKTGCCIAQLQGEFCFCFIALSIWLANSEIHYTVSLLHAVWPWTLRWNMMNFYFVPQWFLFFLLCISLLYVDMSYWPLLLPSS